MPSRALSHFSQAKPSLLIALLSLIATIPLWVPGFPPLPDVPGHMGRYAVQLGLASDPILAQWFTFRWAPIGNLGVDLLIELLGPVLGIELALKLIVIGIVALITSGFLRAALKAQGRIGPAALFALPLAYGQPFQFGFINYCLSIGLALHAFVLWMRLGAQGRIRFRALIFVPVSIIVWTAHIGGWGALGLLALASEVVRQRALAKGYVRSWGEAGIGCLPLALPLMLTLLMHDQASGAATAHWFEWNTKFQWMAMMLADKWQSYDIFCAGILAFVIVAAAILSDLKFNPVLGLAALLLFGAMIVIPRVLLGSAYADMRLAGLSVGLALLAINLRDDASRLVGRALLLGGLAFFVIRTAGTTASFISYDKTMRAELVALDYVPRHSRIVALVGRHCYAEWQLERRSHLPSMAIVRRHALTNDQFILPGAQLIGVRHREGLPFVSDPSQMVTADNCTGSDWPTFSRTLARIPRGAFDYLWVIGAPEQSDPDLRDFVPVWRNQQSTLYRIEK